MSNKLLNFKSHQCFYKYINTYLPAFDIKNSIAKGRFTFIYNGEIKPYRNLYQFLGELNGILKEDLFCIKNSRITSRTRYKIFVDSEVEANLKPVLEEAVEEVVPESPAETELPVEDEVSEAVEETVVEDTPEVTVEEVSEVEFEIDWSWVESLEDTPENKIALDEYAEKNSDVRLKRNMKLVNMVRAYKKAVA